MEERERERERQREREGKRGEGVMKGTGYTQALWGRDITSLS
jgi:hypothetical protein